MDSLPDGMRTPVGERGARLSGGQRRRLVLARALLADFPVLILDEPTEHLDDENAAAITADLLAATAGRSVVLITHRPYGLDAVDEVVRLEDSGTLRRDWQEFGGEAPLISHSHSGCAVTVARAGDRQDEDGTRRFADALLAHRTEDGVPDPAVPMAAQHEKVASRAAAVSTSAARPSATSVAIVTPAGSLISSTSRASVRSAS